jgi:transcriptional regulator with XRE-family HTH domain
MSIVSDLRLRSGLTQEQLAERAGTSRSRLSAYENSRTSPELDTLERLARAADVELAIAPVGTRRVASHITLVAEAAKADRVSDAVRLVAELLAFVRDGVVAIECFDHEPASTGDRRWDSLLAGVAEMIAQESGRAVPGWAASPARVLDRPWFVTRLRTVRPDIYRRTPAALSARGVLLSAESLESV